MAGVKDFRAAIQEARDRAQRAFDEKLRLDLIEAQSPDAGRLSIASNEQGAPPQPVLELVSTSTGAIELPATESIQNFLGSPTLPIEVEQPEEAQPTVLAPRRPSTATGYANLLSAKKRKRSEVDTGPTRLHSTKQSKIENEGREENLHRPHAPAKKAPRGARPAESERIPVDTRHTTMSSDWYNHIDLRQKFSRSDLQSVQLINTFITQCQTAVRRSEDQSQHFANIRQRIHKMEFFDFLSGVIIKKSKVLDERIGLPQIFDNGGGVRYPWDIRADAQALYIRWLQGDLDPHLLRGIDSGRKQRVSGKSSIAHRLEPGYPAKRSCSVVGDNNLLNGQWWPMQICAMRDGAHGEIEGGIHGAPGKGALSIILSSGGYDDLDEGDRILYCGTSGAAEKPTAGTNHMKEAKSLGNPVRVLRSSALPAKNQYRPSKGLRYDGLYTIIDEEILDVATAMHRFSLRRIPGQDPIRCDGVEARPTSEEIAEYVKIRKLIGLTT